jgi:hypothetical protein
MIKMTALNAIKEIGVIPMSAEKPCSHPSNSEIMRWCNNGSVIINGKKPKANEIVEFPIKELIFFPKAKRRTTVI